MVDVTDMKKTVTPAKPEVVKRDRQHLTVIGLMKGRSFKSLAADAGVSPSTPKNWQKPVSKGGVKRPQLHTMIKVGKALGIRLEWMDENGNIVGK